MSTIEFETKLTPLQDLLFSFAMKLTRNKEDAKDLMQETFVRAYSNVHRYRIGTNFKAWMSTIMRNAFINNYRKRRTRKLIEQPMENFLFATENKSSGNSAHSQLMMGELEVMMNSLSDEYKVPFLMFFNGYHYDEIAEEMEIPMGTVKSRIFFARKKLKAMIQAQYGVTHFRRA